MVNLINHRLWTFSWNIMLHTCIEIDVISWQFIHRTIFYVKKKKKIVRLYLINITRWKKQLQNNHGLGWNSGIERTVGRSVILPFAPTPLPLLRTCIRIQTHEYTHTRCNVDDIYHVHNVWVRIILWYVVRSRIIFFIFFF